MKIPTLVVACVLGAVLNVMAGVFVTYTNPIPLAVAATFGAAVGFALLAIVFSIISSR